MRNYEFWTAAGTVGAVIISLAIALTQATVALCNAHKNRRRTRRKVASLVSTWVEVTYAPSQKGEYYRRSASLHVANESDEPVFRVSVVCGIDTGQGIIQVGPLSAPRIIPVLPPKREFTYDVTMGFLGFGYYAHDSFQSLVASVAFSDHEGASWERNFDGALTEAKRDRAGRPVEAQDELSYAQAGPADYPYNPLGTVFKFVDLAANQDLSDEIFHQSLRDEASGWGDETPEDIARFREILCTSNLALHVWYPTPRIAYARILPPDSDMEEERLMRILTLVWRKSRGWTLFGLGSYLPWQIPFPKGELDIDPLDDREMPPRVAAPRLSRNYMKRRRA